MTMTTKASDLLVRCLESEGITHVFAVPGEENADVMFSLEGASLTTILTRQEQGAAFMAEVYGRLTGSPAVCLGTLGPGATNLITGVADANLDRAPLLVLTGQAEATRRHKESHQVMNVVEMYRPATKWTCAVAHPDTIPEIVRKCVRLARAEKPGATHIELPEDVARLEASTEPMSPKRFRRPAPDDALCDDAWSLIRRSSRPIILAGNGTIRKRASDELRALCEMTGIGVLSTFMGKGCVDMDADYCLFSIGLQGQDHSTLALESADLVIAVGYDLVEYPPRVWNREGQTPVLHIDFEPAEIDQHYDPALELVGDIAQTLSKLSDRARRDGAPRFAWEGAQRVRERMLSELREHAEDDAVGAIKPQKAIWDARQSLGPQDLLLSGVGAHKMWVGRYYHCHEPNTCLIPNGFCSMGMPLPGAIAAHLVYPDRKVLGLAGDGDFLMNVQEMETAARLAADLTMMVWVDRAYGLIAWKQEQEFGRHTALDFGNPDWVKLAESFGWTGWWVDRSTELSATLQTALDTPGPSLVALPIDYRENMKLTERLGRLRCTL